LKFVYFENYDKDEVDEEFEKEERKTRREIWRNDAKEKYYRSFKTFNDAEIASDEFNPEKVFIDKLDKTEQKIAIEKFLKTLTKEQRQLIKMFLNGESVTVISKKIGVSKAAVSQMRRRIQNKFKKFYKTR